ncbi:MAG: excinuclease ABC subunit UvrA [Promethearchaeati archaeon SRVP18_Atabeyarchaeia-1]
MGNASLIVVKGARQNNLKNIDVEIPRDKLVVITGVSGSGKSSLAFDTLYAEGQRRYIESLSAYARQFLEQMSKPDVDYIEGLSPAICIEQRTASRNPRSTVATVTEIHDYLRLLFARIGIPHCYKCGKEIKRQTLDQIVDQVMKLRSGSRIQILAPVVRARKGEHKEILEKLRKQGFVRIRLDGRNVEVEEVGFVDKKKKHTIEAIVDRLSVKDETRGRIADSVQTALKLSEGLVIIRTAEDGKEGGDEQLYSEQLSCPDCGVSYGELNPRNFSFNSPFGACRECSGLGVKMNIDPELVIPDKTKSIAEGGIVPMSKNIDSWWMQSMKSLADHYGFSLDTPLKDLTAKQLHVILYGSGEEKIKFRYEDENKKVLYEHERPTRGVINNLERRFVETKSEEMRAWYQKFMSVKRCPACNGDRLRPESLAVKISEKSLAEMTKMSVSQSLKFFDALKLTEKEQLIAHQVLKEIKSRLGFLMDVGLDYLTLDRTTSTLSGGEAQRTQLATQIGTSLVGVLYILDEPSIGLHQRDLRRMIETLKRLRNLGNTVIIVEHDEQTIRAADWVVDLGPGAGAHGGYLVSSGTVEEVAKCEKSITGQYLSGKLKIPVPSSRRPGNGKYITVRGARENNLKNIDVKIPLGLLICITGVSGSGKSTLLDDILYRALARTLHGAKEKPGAHDRIEGIQNIDKAVMIDQSPIGRTPRSNPATYTGVFTFIRDLFSKLQEARARGYKPGRFSFNVSGGRCEACKGDGIIRLEMQFLPDVYVPCEVCKGNRYNRETLEITYKEKNIADILSMTIDEAVAFFENIPHVKAILQTICDVGLGYIKLGQPATTLSGGEAQRVKLATELCRRATGKTLYMLDEPTTGLHFADIHKLLEVLSRLTDAGNTVIVIEHNLDVIKTADLVIDLGPEGGQENGGRIIAQGTPEEIARVPQSYTGQFLKKVLVVDAEEMQGEATRDSRVDLQASEALRRSAP